jgi:hypothetical protein
MQIVINTSLGWSLSFLMRVSILNIGSAGLLLRLSARFKIARYIHRSSKTINGSRLTTPKKACRGSVQAFALLKLALAKRGEPPLTCAGVAMGASLNWGNSARYDEKG